MKNGYLIPIHSYCIRVDNPSSAANTFYRNDFKMTQNVCMLGFSLLYANAGTLGTSGSEPKIQTPNYVESVSFPDNPLASYVEQEYFTSGGNTMLIAGDLIAIRPVTKDVSIRLSHQNANGVIQYSLAFNYILEDDLDAYMEFMKALKR